MDTVTFIHVHVHRSAIAVTHKQKQAHATPASGQYTWHGQADRSRRRRQAPRMYHFVACDHDEWPHVRPNLLPHQQHPLITRALEPVRACKIQTNGIAAQIDSTRNTCAPHNGRVDRLEPCRRCSTHQRTRSSRGNLLPGRFRISIKLLPPERGRTNRAVHSRSRD